MATDNFHVFAKAFRKRFDELAKGSLFVLDAKRNEIWDLYLAAFPAGSNPVFRTNTQHDCSCCRHFIRDIGNVVAIKNGELTSVWDLKDLPYPYQDVADKLAADVRLLAVRNVLLMPRAPFGEEKTFARLGDSTHAFFHFNVRLPGHCVHSDYVEQRGKIRTTFDVLYRGLTELTPTALTTVADLIDSNALYRGAEFKRSVDAFRELQARVFGVNDPEVRKLLIWEMVNEPVARFRNTVIGTLVQDLSEGKDLEAAVRMYEAKVAPQNYKRPTALISKSMVDSAMKTIAELGLGEALERRHARFSDVSVNSVLFVDNAVRGTLKGGLKDLLMEEVKPAPFDPKNAEEVTIDAFLTDVLPKVTTLGVHLTSDLMGNFMSLTAPVHSDVKQLFRWGNDFAWSYDGNVTDSIKERVKRAGGKVEGVAFRVSLAWFNTDDLDLHVYEPDGTHIYFGNKSGSGRGGRLDVDMNVMAYVRNAVENVRWNNPLKEGTYRVVVHQFTKRESIDVGFDVETEGPGGLSHFRYEKALGHGAQVKVADIEVQKYGLVIIKPGPGILHGETSQEKWGVKTLTQVRVNSLILSPNYWDGSPVGNKHWFFILDGCSNPLPTRGIYNEFLHPRLEPHRKVFEVLGDKTKCPPVPEQMSGLGFSSTLEKKLTVIATGPALNKAYTIVFGAQ